MGSEMCIRDRIRGDVSKSRLLLSEMPAISIDSKNISVGYGVIADNTFWCKQGILTTANVRAVSYTHLTLPTKRIV